MQVHGEDSIGPRHRDEVRHQAGGDGDPGLVLLVRAAVGVVGEDGGDATGRGSLGRVDHDEQLHQGVVHRVGGGLDDEDVPLADVLLVLDEGVVVAELEDLGLAMGDAKIGTHVLG